MDYERPHIQPIFYIVITSGSRERKETSFRGRGILWVLNGFGGMKIFLEVNTGRMERLDGFSR